MLDKLVAFDFSVYTLLVANIIPFIFFGIMAKYSDSDKQARMRNAFLGLTCLTLAALVLARVLFFSPGMVFEDRLFGLLHIAPLVLTSLAIGQERTNRKAFKKHTQEKAEAKELSDAEIWDEAA